MPVEVEIHNVTHMKVVNNTKVKIKGLIHGGTFILYHILVNLGHLLYKSGLIESQSSTTVFQGDFFKVCRSLCHMASLCCLGIWCSTAQEVSIVSPMKTKKPTDTPTMDH